MPWAPAGLVQGSILLAAHNDTARYVSWTIAVPVTAAFPGGSHLRFSARWLRPCRSPQRLACPSMT